MGLFSSLLAPVDTYVCLPAIYEIDSTGETDVIVETGVDGLTSIKGPQVRRLPTAVARGPSDNWLIG